MELNWRSWGSGPAQVLALHCGLGHSGMWKATAAPLAQECIFRAPDLPGHGKSNPFPEGQDVHDAAYGALQAQLTPGLHLVGHSFGATLALRLALRAPDLVASMLLIEPVFFAAAPESDLRASHRAAEEQVFTTYATGDLMATARAFNRLWGGGVPWDRFPTHVQAAMASQMPFVVGTEPSLWRDGAKMLVPETLEQVSCPVTFMRGSDTVPIIAEVHRGLMARIPQSQEIVVSGAGHMLVMTHPEAVTAALVSHISDGAALSE
jgi:lipase